MPGYPLKLYGFQYGDCPAAYASRFTASQLVCSRVSPASTADGRTTAGYIRMMASSAKKPSAEAVRPHEATNVPLMVMRR